MKIPQNCVGKILGKMGATVHEIEDQSKCHIKINQDTKEAGFSFAIVTNNGSDESALDAAERLINEKIAESNAAKSGAVLTNQMLGAGKEVKELRVDDIYVGGLIGRGGENIKSMTAEVGCKIQINQKGGGEQASVVIGPGSVEQIAKGEKLVEDKCAEILRQRAPAPKPPMLGNVPFVPGVTQPRPPGIPPLPGGGLGINSTAPLGIAGLAAPQPPPPLHMQTGMSMGMASTAPIGAPGSLPGPPGTAPMPPRPPQAQLGYQAGRPRAPQAPGLPGGSPVIGAPAPPRPPPAVSPMKGQAPGKGNTALYGGMGAIGGVGPGGKPGKGGPALGAPAALPGKGGCSMGKPGKGGPAVGAPSMLPGGKGAIGAKGVVVTPPSWSPGPPGQMGAPGMAAGNPGAPGMAAPGMAASNPGGPGVVGGLTAKAVPGQGAMPPAGASGLPY